MKSLISVAAASDAPALLTLRTQVAHHMTQQFGEGAWSEPPGEADVIQQLSVSRVLVARRDREIIGTVRLARANSGAIDSGLFTPVSTALYVLGLAVSVDARGHGVGRGLMEAAKEVAGSEPVDALWLDAYEHSAGAGSFYLKCGFRQVGRTSYRDMPLMFYEWLKP